MTRTLSAALALALSLLLACSKEKESDSKSAAVSPPATGKPGQVILPPDSPKLAQIRVASVQVQEVPTDEVTAPGKIEVNPNRVTHVVLPLAGRIAAVNVKLGDAVEQGDVVLAIESPDADAAMSGYLQAQSSITQAKATLMKAQADLDRVRDLYEHNAIAKKEVLNAENAATQAQTTLEQAEAASKQALSRIQILGLKPGLYGQKVAVKAPISGKVLEISVVPGEYRNDTNASLMTIADLSTVWVAADVPESAIRLIEVNERITMELTAFPGERFGGRVMRIADMVDPQTRTIKVRAELDNSRGRFRPEMFGRIRHTHPGRMLPVIPATAVVQGDGKNFVYAEVSPGTFKQTPVSLGNRAGEVFPVLGGLKAGDRIVVDGTMLLKGV
jgi:cobalt-zinc-cadmium efflux system membrane fusion protein